MKSLKSLWPIGSIILFLILIFRIYGRLNQGDSGLDNSGIMETYMENFRQHQEKSSTGADGELFYHSESPIVDIFQEGDGIWVVERTTFGDPQFIWIKSLNSAGEILWSQKLEGYYRNASWGNGKILITSVIDMDTIAEFIIWEVDAKDGRILHHFKPDYSALDFEITVTKPLPNGNFLFSVSQEESNEFKICTYNAGWEKISCNPIRYNFETHLLYMDLNDEREIYLAAETYDQGYSTNISCLGIQPDGGYKHKWTQQLPDTGSSPQGIVAREMGDFWVVNDSFQKRQAVHFIQSKPTQPITFSFDDKFPLVEAMKIGPNGDLEMVFINYYFRDKENRQEKDKLGYYWVEIDKENKVTVLGPKTFKNFQAGYWIPTAPVAIINSREILVCATSTAPNSGSYHGNVYKVKF